MRVTYVKKVADKKKPPLCLEARVQSGSPNTAPGLRSKAPLRLRCACPLVDEGTTDCDSEKTENVGFRCLLLFPLTTLFLPDELWKAASLSTALLDSPLSLLERIVHQPKGSIVPLLLKPSTVRLKSQALNSIPFSMKDWWDHSYARRSAPDFEMYLSTLKVFP